jgi:hypothetical protein
MEQHADRSNNEVLRGDRKKDFRFLPSFFPFFLPGT